MEAHAIELATAFSHIPFYQFLQVFARKGISAKCSTSLLCTICFILFYCKGCHYSFVLLSLSSLRGPLQFGLTLQLPERLLQNQHKGLVPVLKHSSVTCKNLSLAGLMVDRTQS